MPDSDTTLLTIPDVADYRLESVVNKVGRHRHRHDQVGPGRKCGGSRWYIKCLYVAGN